MKSFVRNAVKRATRKILSPLYGAVENITKHAVYLRAADEYWSRRLYRFTKSPHFAQNIVRCPLKKQTCTVSNIKLVKRQSAIAVVIEAMFYDLWTNLGKVHEEEAPPSPLRERSMALFLISEHDEKKKHEKKKQSSQFSWSSGTKHGSSKCSSKSYKVDVHNRGAKGVSVLPLLSTNFAKGTIPQHLSPW